MDVFELAAKITLDDSGYKKGISAARKTFSAMTKIATVAVTASGAAITAIVKKAVDAYGEYEQLAGGAQKIFDEIDFTKIANDAQNAYKELNLSASEYLASINNVGATFAQTMGDEKGYETARKGMLAVADYASGTGKSVDELMQKYQMITRATSSYQSIADQFSGILPATTTDFLKQAQAAGLLSTKYKQLTQVPVAEYQEAVTAMLEKGVADLGLAQNTLNETTETITGSLAATKAAWKNLITGLGDETADLDTLFTNLVDSVEVSFKNLLPVIERAIGGAGELVKRLAPTIAEKLPGLLKELIPAAISVAGSVISALVDAVPDLLSELWNAIGDFMAGTEYAGAWETFSDAVTSLFNFITDNGEAVIAAISGIAAAFALYTGVTAIVGALTTAQAALNAVLLANPILLVVSLIAGFVAALVTAYNTSETFRNAVNELWQEYKTAWQELVAEGKKTVQAIIDAFADLGKKAVEWGSSIVNGIKEGITSAWGNFKDYVSGLWEGIKSIFSGGISVPITGGTGTGHAIGLDYVPYNDYPARLHKGEAVLTRDEAEHWRRGQGSSPTVINQYIQTVPQTPAEFGAATESYFEQARWALA